MSHELALERLRRAVAQLPAEGHSPDLLLLLEGLEAVDVSCTLLQTAREQLPPADASAPEDYQDPEAWTARLAAIEASSAGPLLFKVTQLTKSSGCMCAGSCPCLTLAIAASSSTPPGPRSHDRGGRKAASVLKHRRTGHCYL